MLRKPGEPVSKTAESQSKAGEPESKAPAQAEAQLIEYECLSCNRRYRLRGTKFYEVAADGSERAYMRQGQYGRWLSCR